MSEMSDEVISVKLDHIQSDLADVKQDVKEIKDGAPLHRIRSLEQWRRGIIAWLSAVSVAMIAAGFTALLR